MQKKIKNKDDYTPQDLMDDLFGGPMLPVDNTASDDFYILDMEAIGHESDIIAASIISNTLKLYNNREFVEEHPDFKKRIDSEIESLRKLYKLSKTNEIIHDHLAQAISKNPGNASLYMALDKVQSRMMTVDRSIKEIIDGLNKICNNYQMELNFENIKNGEEKAEEDGLSVRGNKAFIDMMNAEDEEDLFDEMDAEDEEDLFDDVE